MAREHLNMLNFKYKSEVAENEFRIYFNENLQKGIFYFDRNKMSFKADAFMLNKMNNWVPEQSFKIKTPKIVKHHVH